MSKRRKLHLEALATPKHRIYQVDKFPLVSRAALRSKMTKRLKLLAQPRQKAKFRNIEKTTSRELNDQTENVEISERLNNLSLPFIRFVKAGLKSQLENKVLKNLKKTLEASEKSMYNAFHYDRALALKNRKKRNSEKKLKKQNSTQLKQREKNFQIWLKKNATPRKVLQPPPPKKSKVVSDDWYQKRLPKLAKPIFKVKKFKDRPKIDESVPKSALNYVPTERIKELSEPREVFEREEPSPIVSPAALKYIASERINIISKPKASKKAPDIDYKENPFQISPKALKAQCTQRVKELAIPKYKTKKR